MVGWQPSFDEVIAHARQQSDHHRRPPHEERLELTQQALTRRSNPKGAQIDERLRPQVADFEHEPGTAQPGRQPAAKRGEGVNRRADYDVRFGPARLHDEEYREEGEHVELASPGVAAVRHRPEPDELDTVEPLAAVQASPGQTLFAAG